MGRISGAGTNAVGGDSASGRKFLRRNRSVCFLFGHWSTSNRNSLAILLTG